jgi:undecaprenyl diphosphate synthase
VTKPGETKMLGLRTRLRALRTLALAKERELPPAARSIAIIMDGNGRWARRHGLPVASGHRAGTRALRRTVETCIELNVRSLAVFAFSTENWSRPKDEVEALMTILAETIEKELPDLAEQGVRTRFIGRRDRVGEDLRTAMDNIEKATADKKRLDLWIAFDYGGRAELIEAARDMLEAGVDPKKLDEEVFTSFLAAPEMPDPDLLIRTSGESRISNFLLWQIAYAELAFVEKLWPEFGPADLRTALQAYARRRRRFGGR